MGTSAGKSAVASAGDSPGKLFRDPSKWASTDGTRATNVIFPYGGPISAGVQAVAAGSKAIKGTAKGTDVALQIPGFSSSKQGVEYATRGAGGTETPPDIPVLPEEQTPQRKRRGRTGRAGTLLTDAGAVDMSGTLGTVGGRSSLLGL